MERMTVKRGVISVGLFFLYRALRACQILDPEVAGELASLPENLQVVIALADQKGGVAFQNCPGGIQRIVPVPEGWEENRAEIRFKTVGAALRMLIGKEDIAKSYARGNILLRGEIRWGMTLMRCFYKAENYIFPAFIRLRLFGTLPDKQVPSRQVYWHMFFPQADQKKLPQKVDGK